MVTLIIAVSWFIAGIAIGGYIEARSVRNDMESLLRDSHRLNDMANDIITDLLARIPAPAADPDTGLPIARAVRAAEGD